MESFLDIVDGSFLSLKEFDSSIRFPSPSDAMLAAFYLKYSNITMDIFDDLFTLFRHELFSLETVNLSGIEDILAHISEQRRSIARDRGSKGNDVVIHTTQTGSHDNVPKLVVELLADHLDSERIPFHQIAHEEYPSCEADDLLRTMCIVHRSWTEATQRNLRRRVYVRGQRGVLRLLQSPQLGPWIRDLSVIVIVVPPMYGELPVAVNIPRLLCEILKRCPNVVNLFLQDFQTNSDPHAGVSGSLAVGSHDRDTIRAVGDLTGLENLWLHQVHGESAMNFSALSNSLHRLQMVKSLSLHNWRENRNGSELSMVSKGARCPIRCPGILSVTHCFGANLSELFSAPTGESKSMVLELSFDDMRTYPFGPTQKTWDIQPFVEPIKHRVTKLMLNDYLYEDDVTLIAAQFPLLQFLCLCTPSGLSSIPFILPQSVEMLHIHFDCSPDDEQDQCAAEQLKVSSHIRKLVITTNRFHDSLPSETFAATLLQCETSNVLFETRKIEDHPLALDL